MPGGTTKFNDKWLETTDNNGDLISLWCKQGRSGNEAFCMLCKNYFMISNSGISQISQHASTNKHQNASKQLKGQKKISFSGNRSTLSSTALQLSNDQMVTRAEAIWAMKVAASNFSFASCKDIVPIFQIMFEEHPTAKHMQIGERKVSYILSHGLGPHFQAEVIDELKSSLNWFTIVFDETTTCQIKKQLDICIRFWSEKSETVVNSYINSVFLGHAESNKICSSIINTLNDLKLPLSKLLMLSMDGPHVNLSVAKKLNEELSVVNSELVDFGTCSLHKIHNSFSKAMFSLSLDVDQFANDLFAFFKLSAARREDLKDIQKLLDCDQKFLLRHVNSRWLTLGSVINRIIEVYPSLNEYFLKFLPQQKSSFSSVQQNPRYKRISSTLQDQSTLVYLQFISDLCPILESYLALFQREGPLIHILYNKVNELVRNVMLKFLKESCVGTLEGKVLLEIDIESSGNFRPIKDLDIGIGARRAISKLKEFERTSLRTELRKCLVILAKHLRETLPVANSFLKDLEVLHPLMRNISSDNAIMRLCLKMKPLNLNDQAIDAIIREWQIYRLDKEVEGLCDKFVTESEDEILQYERVDVYWAKVLKLTDKNTGVPKYEKLSKLIKSCLSLSHGNADVERGFSVNNAIVSSDRVGLGEKTIIGLRMVKDAIRRHGSILNIPITGKLLNSVTKAYSVYNEDKRKEQELLLLGEEEKKRAQHESEQVQKKLKTETKEKLSEMEKYVKSLTDDLNVAQALLNEGNERLQKAIKKKDFKEMSIASSMIESGTAKVKFQTEKIAEAEKKKSKLNS